eukprot:157568_1
MISINSTVSKEKQSIPSESTLDITVSDCNDYNEEEINGNQSHSMIKKIIKLTVIIAIICIMILFTNRINKCFQSMRDPIKNEYGAHALAIIMCIVFSLWLAVSPNGSGPTIVSGILFSDNPWIGITVAYLSINIGAVLNLLWIRCIVLKYEQHGCVKFILKYFGISKFRKMKTVSKLFKIWSAMKIIVILRLPYVNAGMMNYLFSFQIDQINVKQFIAGNAIGFLPGCILCYLLLGQTLKILSSINPKGQGCSKAWENAVKNKSQLVAFFIVVVIMVGIYAWLINYVRSVIKKIDKDVENSKLCVENG